MIFADTKLPNKNLSTHSVPFIKGFVVACCSLLLAPAYSQTSASLKVDGATLRSVTLRDYLSQVQQSNAFLKTKTLGIESSVAMEEAMGMPNINPSLTYSRGTFYSSKPSEIYSPQSNTYSVSATIEAPGKRQARKDYAAVEVSRTKLDAQASVKAVEGDAAFAFIDSLRLKLIWQALQTATDNIQAINDKDAAAAIENHANIQKTITNDFKYFALSMNSFVGQGVAQLFEPSGSLNVPARDFKPADYSATALARRNDIVTLEAALKVAQENFNLVEKNRRVDVITSLWHSRTPAYTYADTTDYGKSGTWGFSLTVPLPMANAYDGPLVQANNSKIQMELFLSDAKARAAIEVNQLLMQYATAKSRLEEVRAYREEGLKDKSRTTQNMVQQRERDVDWIDAQANHAKSLIQVLRAMGDYTLPNLN